MLSTVERPRDAVVPRSETRRASVFVRICGHIAWIVALAVAVVVWIARFGFAPADQGFILSGSWRVLHGEIPHADFISARPMGSSLLHTIDFLLPAPLLLSSEFIAMVEIIVTTIACAALLTRTSPLCWGPLRTLAVAAAALVNLHLFTLMAWHTIDGLMFTAVGWWLLDAGLRADNAWQRRIGLAMLGFAVITKQSFALAVPVGLLMLFLHKGSRTWRRVVVDLLCLGAVPVLYFGVVTAAGGLPAAIEQLTSATAAYGQLLIGMWQTDFSRLLDLGVPDSRRAVLLVLALAVVLAVLVRREAGRWSRILVAAVLAGVTLNSLAASRLTYPPLWSVKLLWIFVAVIVVDIAVRRRFPWRPLLLVILAYSASLSWGYDNPALVSGTLVLATLDILHSAVPEVRIERRAATALIGVVAFAATSFLLMDAHSHRVATDQPPNRLTVDLGTFSPELAGTRTGPNTATYLRQLKDCLAKYPATDVAVLPDNTFIYPVLKLHNPFPVDWPLHFEVVGDAIARTNATIDKLNQNGHYLVLFQTVSVDTLRAGGPVPVQVSVNTPIVDHSVPVQLAKDRLTGQRVTCGSFVGVWAP